MAGSSPAMTRWNVAPPAITVHPHPGTSPIRERGTRPAPRSPRDLPGGSAVLVVLELDAHGGEFIADAVGLGPVFCRAGGGASKDAFLDFGFGDCEPGPLARLPLHRIELEQAEQPSGGKRDGGVIGLIEVPSEG